MHVRRNTKAPLPLSRESDSGVDTADRRLSSINAAVSRMTLDVRDQGPTQRRSPWLRSEAGQPRQESHRAADFGHRGRRASSAKSKSNPYDRHPERPPKRSDGGRES